MIDHLDISNGISVEWHKSILLISLVNHHQHKEIRHGALICFSLGILITACIRTHDQVVFHIMIQLVNLSVENDLIIA